MSIFTRLSDIISSNINAMLDKAEDPEKLIKLMISEMEDTLVDIKANCAGSMATQKRIQREMASSLDMAHAWGDKASLAVDKNRPDLAREALVEKRRFVERAEFLESDLASVKAVVEQYHNDIRQLEDKLQGAREKRRALVQRHRHALDKRRAEDDIRRYETSDVLARFDRFEHRIDRMEAEAELVNGSRKPTLEDSFKSLEQDDDIERELAALIAKKRSGDTASQ